MGADNEDSNSSPKPTVESVENHCDTDTDTNTENDDLPLVESDPDWTDVGKRVVDELEDAVEIIQTAGEGETIHDWDDAAAEWTYQTRPNPTSVCLLHDSGAWVRIEDSSVTNGYNVLVCAAGDERVPQRSLWSMRGHSYLLSKCESHAVAKMLKYTRDGEF